MASTYLTRATADFGTATNRKKCTISFWVKRSLTASQQAVMGAETTPLGGSNEARIVLRGDDTLEFYDWQSAYKFRYITNRVFRDTSAWYHIVLAIDTTHPTGSQRIKMYINGVEETSFGTSTDPAQNLDTFLNSGAYIQIGRQSTGNSYLDGSLSHYHFIDGTAYDASYFGETDATTGEWKIKTSPSVTYGTNGFFILKDGNSVTDQSGNSNNWTVGGGTLTKTEDCPDNVFATFNPLASKVLGTVGFTLENGSTVLNPSSNTNQWTTSTICTPSTGKFYWEMKSVQGSATDWPDIGFMFTDSISTHMANSANTQHNFSYATAIESNGTKWDFGTQTTSWFGGFGNGDIISCAVDVNAGKFWWGVNGSWLNSGDPANGTNHGSNFTAGTSITAWVEQYNAGDVLANFGNGYFGTTAVSSAGTNASGIGIFEYDVPAGFTALSTKGLNL